jgi:Protein of unknown function (DUF1688)
MPRPDEPSALLLLSASAVRERAGNMLQAGLADALPNFRVNLAQLRPTASYVADVIRENYPDLQVPLHARWRHFVFGQNDLWAEIARRTHWRDERARARAAFDLAVISVLLDAGAGSDWRYHDQATGLTAGRSEGLALASLRMFEAGVFSADPRDPLRADGTRLEQLTDNVLANGLGIRPDNVLAGLEGRVALLTRLGHVVRENPDVFANGEDARVGGLVDYLLGTAVNRELSAPCILQALLTHLAPIWPGRLRLDGIPLGDTWRHPSIKRDDATDGLVPLHKLSQWLTYSLIEPLRDAGLNITEIDGLTGLAEYRNGGLFIDTGVFVPRDPATAAQMHSVDSELVVEWRGLTVALLDRVAPLVKDELGVSKQAFPLACVLQGGTWSAGRRIALGLRPDGRPPLNVAGDGTVF